jgi:hypothetical protein
MARKRGKFKESKGLKEMECKGKGGQRTERGGTEAIQRVRKRRITPESGHQKEEDLKGTGSIASPWTASTNSTLQGLTCLSNALTLGLSRRERMNLFLSLVKAEDIHTSNPRIIPSLQV